MAVRTLGKLGYKPEVAATGVAVLDLLENNRYDLIFMDIQMPETDGLQATKNIRKNFEEQPIIIAMTANAMTEDKDICLKAGMDDYISKPFKIENVIDAVVKWSRFLHERSPYHKGKISNG